MEEKPTWPQTFLAVLLVPFVIVGLMMCAACFAVFLYGHVSLTVLRRSFAPKRQAVGPAMPRPHFLYLRSMHEKVEPSRSTPSDA